MQTFCLRHAGKTSSNRSVTITVAAVVIVFIACNVTAMTSHLFYTLEICYEELKYLGEWR